MSENASTSKPASRPSVMSLAIRERAALYAAYMPYIKGGGLFIPTNRPYALGDEVYLLLTLMDDPTKHAITGKVVWITPAGTQTGKLQGIGIQFAQDDAAALARRKIEDSLGGALKSARQTHTI